MSTVYGHVPTAKIVPANMLFYDALQRRRVTRVYDESMDSLARLGFTGTGVILFVAPWIFGTARNGTSSWDAWVVGILGVILALWALASLSTATIAQWVSLILGVWLFLSPWILGFAAVSAAAWVAWIIGVLFVIVNGWTLLQERTPRVGATA